MIRFASIGSGSEGNGLIVEAGNTSILVDCGFGLKETKRRLERLDLQPENLSAILVTHEHSDHVGGVARLARRHQIPVWATFGTFSAWPELATLNLIQPFDSHDPFVVGDLSIQPFPVPHDAREPVQYVFADGHVRLGLLTDTGTSTPHIEAMLNGCDALILECNHDLDLLQHSDYPWSLKQRIGGRLGHLDNQTAAGLLSRLDHSRLQHLIAAHLSDSNNSPALARAALASVMGCAQDWIGVAEQEAGLGWRQVN